jgi:hypothetical protein
MYIKARDKLANLMGVDPERNPIPDFIIIAAILWGCGRFFYGAANANDKEHCIVRSIGDVIIAPMYTIGCNVGKDRFEVRVN